MKVSLSFLYHKFATLSHTAILLRNPSPVYVCVCVCVSTHVHVGECGCVRACACHLRGTLNGMCMPFRVYPGVGHVLLECPRLIIRHEGLF